MKTQQLKRKITAAYQLLLRIATNKTREIVLKAVVVTGVILLLLFQFNPWFYHFKFISNSRLNALTNIAAFVLAFLAIIDEFSTILKRGFLKSITFKFCLIAFACDIAFIASDKKDDQNDSAKLAQIKIDSIAKAKTATINGIKDDRRNRLYQDSLTVGLTRMAKVFNLALGSDQSKYKHARDEIADIVRKDSAKEIKYILQTRPVLDLVNVLFVKQTPDSLYFQLKLQCRQSTAYDIHLTTKIGFILKNGRMLRFHKDNDDYDSGEQLESDKIRTAELLLPRYIGTAQMAFNVVGYYTDFANRNQHIPFDKIVLYDITIKKEVSFELEDLKNLRRRFSRY